MQEQRAIKNFGIRRPTVFDVGIQHPIDLDVGIQRPIVFDVQDYLFWFENPDHVFIGASGIFHLFVSLSFMVATGHTFEFFHIVFKKQHDGIHSLALGADRAGNKAFFGSFGHKQMGSLARPIVV